MFGNTVRWHKMSISAQAKKLGFAVSGKLSPREGKEPARRCRYYEDEAGNVYIVRRGILTIVAANGKVY
jgi:hypothetical protein